jgi:2-polyprenyl-3-methyl-5-hydroxy-6-metoxy-1,4-benzoquinol methylase
MTAPRAASRPSPQKIFDALNAYQLTMAIRGAIDLELFTHIDEGAVEPIEIARRSHASERGIRILCDYLTVHGFLTKTSNAYALTPESAAFLSKRSPGYLGSLSGFLAHDYHISHFRNMAGLVRKGGSIEDGNMGPDDPIWVEFARAMEPAVAISARALAPLVARAEEPIKVLDVAAGHGVWGLAIAQLNPVAEIYATDWANVLEVARENAASSGMSERYHLIPGSAFDVELGAGYDLVLLPNFVHHFDPPTNVRLLEKIRRAMKPSGTLATVELMPNDDRISPARFATFSLMMLGTTPAGDAYTFAELKVMLEQAGFAENRLEILQPTAQPVILSRA